MAARIATPTNLFVIWCVFIYAPNLKHGITIKMSLWNNFGSIVSSCNSTVQTISAGRLSKLFQLTRLHSSLSLARVTQSEQLIYVFMSCWLSQLTFTLTLTFCVHSSIMFQVPFKWYAFNKYTQIIMSTYFFDIYTLQYICEQWIANRIWIRDRKSW